MFQVVSEKFLLECFRCVSSFLPFGVFPPCAFVSLRRAHVQMCMYLENQKNIKIYIYKLINDFIYIYRYINDF